MYITIQRISTEAIGEVWREDVNDTLCFVNLQNLVNYIYFSVYSRLGKVSNKLKPQALNLPLNQVKAASCLHNSAHLARLETKGSIFELLLHVSLAKVSKVTSLTSRRAVGFTKSELTKCDTTRLDLLLVVLDDLKSLLLGARDLSLQ
jgi:hypothetical protein